MGTYSKKNIYLQFYIYTYNTNCIAARRLPKQKFIGKNMQVHKQTAVLSLSCLQDKSLAML